VSLIPPTAVHNAIGPIQNEEADTTNIRYEVRDIAGHHIRMVDEDYLDNEAVSAPETIGHPVTIQELFDFTSIHWVDVYAKSAHRSFDEELELYELLDLDAEGEDVADIEVDDTTADILMG
jgi:hypothetical protein